MPLGVTPADSVATSFLIGYNSVFPSVSTATNIGGLSQDKTDLNVLSQIDPNIKTNMYKFSFDSGSALKMNFSNETNTSSLRVQLFDSAGTLVADNYGTSTQQAAYSQLDSSSGLTAANGQYYVQVSYAPNNAKTPIQNYNFQIYSGTTYSNSIVTSAQTQAYDPNLFVSAANSVASSGNVDAYAQSATFASNPTAANAIDIGTLIQNQSQLSATSKLATTNSTEYYSFNFQQGSAIKLAFNNTTQYPNANAVRVQLYNSSGSVLADNYGTSAQQQAYIELTSGVGLGAANGNYTVKVSVPPKQALTATQSYNLQLYSGTSYAQSYQTTAKLPSASSNSSNANSYGSNLNVYEAANAQSFSRSAYNSINQNALSATNIGWLSENKTSLSVLSQLTTADSADYYSFTFQQGSSAKFKFTNSTNTSDLRVQLYDVSGLHVIADNYGTAAQQTAFNDLTSSTGLNLKNEQYTVKVSYAPNADRGNTQTYNFALYSGLSYTQQDHTTASAQTYQNAILNGTVGSGSYNAGTAAASYLNDLSNGSTPDVMSALTAFV